MFKATRRRIGSPAWLALALVVGLPAMAEAQLFPNRTIRRQRESCANEPPYYAQVRSEYYGYFPTCWSKFPAGWQCPCPNPELPNATRSFQEIPRDKRPTADEMNGGSDMGPDGGDPGMSEEPPATDPNQPGLPSSRSPFDMENPNQPVNPGTGNGPNRDGVPPANRGPVRPPGVTQPAPPPPGGTTSTLMEMPSIAAPALAADSTAATAPTVSPGAMAMAADATVTATAATGSTRPDLGPLPSAPMPLPYSPNDSGNGFGPAIPPAQAVPASSSGAGNQPTATATSGKAPRRRILGGLFGQGDKRVR